MLTHASDIFQRIAVGWEQVAFDKTDTEFVTKFDATQTKIKNVIRISFSSSIAILLTHYYF